jgi:hypothetical protein
MKYIMTCEVSTENGSWDYQFVEVDQDCYTDFNFGDTGRCYHWLPVNAVGICDVTRGQPTWLKEAAE